MPTFRHGKSTVVFADEFDLSPYLSSVSDTNAVDTIETTTFGAAQRTYVVGHKDGSVSFEGMFDGTADAADEIFEAALSDTDGLAFTIGNEGFAVGRRARLLVAKETSYEVSSPLTDVVAISGEATADGGLDYGVILAAQTAATANFTGTSVDNTAGTTGGYVAHLHVTANTRNGSSTIKIQHSADNSTWADLVTFSSVSGTTVTSQRSVATGSVSRYLRATGTIGGSTGSITLSVALARR